MANLWQRFKKLIPGAPLLVVTVQTIYADNTCLVATFGGGTMLVTGVTVPVGDNAFVKDGLIIGPAPNLPAYEVDV